MKSSQTENIKLFQPTKESIIGVSISMYFSVTYKMIHTHKTTISQNFIADCNQRAK